MRSNYWFATAVNQCEHYIHLCIETFDMSLLYSFFFTVYSLFHCKYIPNISWASWKRHACLFLLLLLNIFSPWFCVCLQWFFIHRSENSYFVRQFHSMSKMRNTQLSLLMLVTKKKYLRAVSSINGDKLCFLIFNYLLTIFSIMQ